MEWAEANLRKAKAKVAEKAAAVEGFERAVRQCERQLAAVVARVKDEEVDEVVEVDVHGEVEEEASVKDEEEETKAVEAAPAGGEDERLAQGFDGVEGCGGPPRPAMGPRSPGWPPPLKHGHPSPRRPESPVWTLRFLLVRVHHRLLGAGRWVWVDRGGGGLSTWTSPCAWGWLRGRGGGNVRCRGRGTSGGGRCPPPPRKGGEDVLVGANQHLHPRAEKGGGQQWRFVAHCWQGLGLGGVEWVGKAWVWTPTWSALLDLGVSAPRRRTGGCMPGWCTASPAGPSPSPSPPQPPLAAPRSRDPPTPRTPSPRHRGPSPPPWTAKGRYVNCVLALI